MSYIWLSVLLLLPLSLSPAGLNTSSVLFDNDLNRNNNAE